MSDLNRREFVSMVAAGTMVAGLPQWAEAQDGARPNIIFIMSDDHAAHALSCYGSKINATPNLDRLAHEGVKFSNCFVTNSICAPSRAAILTGKYAHKNGQKTNGQVFDGSQQTFPKLLQQAGYQTAMIGKWHLASDPTGFDYWNVLPGQGQYHDPAMIEMGERKKHEGYATDLITDFSIDYLKNRRDKDKPFCLMMQHKAPHRAWDPDGKHADMYEEIDVPEPDTLFDDHENRATPAANTTMTIARHLTERDVKGKPPEGLEGDAKTRWYYQRYIKDYLRCVASVDDNVGRFLDYLDQSGLAKNTIVVYTSDQGFFLGDHGWFDKRFMYEESLRMPLLVRFPTGAPAGQVRNEMVLNVDFAPTFLSLAGVAVPSDMQGRNFLPVLQGEIPDDWRNAMYYHYYEYPAVHSVRRHYGVRTERYKLIHYYYQMDEWELFDLRRDPEELHSVYADPAYADVVARLKREILRLQEELGDTEINTGITVHPDFAMVLGAEVENAGDGYRVATKSDGFALKKTPQPWKERAEFHCTVKSEGESGLRNGLITFGSRSEPRDLVNAGVYIGAGDFVIVQGPFGDRGEDHITRLAVDFDKSKTFDVKVDVDLREKKITLTVDGKTVEAPLERDWDAINYYGYSVFNTASKFGPLEANGA